MKKILLFLLIVVGITATAQVKVGNNPTNLAANAKFQVEGSTGAQTVILDNGNVGLGTSAPTMPLSIVGKTNATGKLKLLQNTSSADDNWWLGFGHGTNDADANDRARIGVVVSSVSYIWVCKSSLRE